jgi:hypothetical protein
MLHVKRVALCSDIYTKYTHVLYERNIKFFNVKHGVWYAGWNENFITPRIPDSHTQRITSTGCRINTVVSPDDGHIVARNM